MDIEFEQGSDMPRVHRRHDGYWAGDFSRTAPMSWQELRRVTELCRPRWPGSP